MLFPYNCKKTGKSVDVEVESLPPASIEYAIRRGLREYFDNYHASYTKDGIVTSKGKIEYDARGFVGTVNDSIDEALERLVAGDVPGTRVVADANLARAKKLAKRFETLSDEEFEAVLARFEPAAIAA